MNGWLSVAIIIVAQIPSSMSAKPIISGVFKRRAKHFACQLFGRPCRCHLSVMWQEPISANLRQARCP